MKITILGTGTSTGVPQIGCQCPVCTSTDPRDKRLRSSAIIHTDRGNNLLIDCGPDFRQQIMQAGAPPLTAALLTHTHYDHVGGIDDLRPYCAGGDFDIYCEPNVAEDLRNRIPYSFARVKYPGVPTFQLHMVDRNKPFTVAGDVITPIPVMHAALPIIGFRIENMAYVTDCKVMPEESMHLLRGLKLLVINALRIEEHMSHMNLRQALELIAVLKPQRAILTHLSHQMGLHERVSATLPDGVEIGTDGMEIEI